MNSKSPPPEKVVAGLIRKSSVEYPLDCTDPGARTLFEQSLIQTRMAELVSDASRDGVVITQWYIDLDVSGRAAYEHKREGLQALLSDARAGRVAVLYARELSRIYRDTVKSILFKAEMKKWKVDVRARDMVRSDDTATETLVQTIQFAVDQFQSERTGIQIRSRNLESFLAGNWPGYSSSIWGLRYNPALKRFDYDPDTADLLVRVLTLLVEERGNGYRTALRLNTARLAGDVDAIEKPGHSGGDWCAKDVLRMAENTLYRRFGTYSKQTKYMPERIPETVPPALLDAVDQALSLRRETIGQRRKRGGREVYTYGPLMRCGHCGGRLRTLRFLRMREAGNPNWLSWACRAGADSRVICPASWSFTQVRLDRLVGRGLAEAIKSARVKLPPGALAPVHAVKDKNSLETSLAKIDAQRERTMRLYTSGVTADFDWVQAETRRLDAARAAMVQQQAAENVPEANTPLRLTPAAAERLVAELERCWQAGPTAEMDTGKRDLLLSLGVSLTISTLPRTKPPAGRGIGKTGRPRKDGGKTGGNLSVVIEISRLGRVGDNSVLCEETEDEWYTNHCVNIRAGVKRREEAKKQKLKENEQGTE